MLRQNQKGFAIIEAVLIVTVLVLLGGVGYFVVSKNNKPATQTSKSATVTATKVTTPTAEINTSLDKAAAVESATIDSSTAEIDKSVDSALDSATNIGDSINEDQL